MKNLEQINSSQPCIFVSKKILKEYGPSLAIYTASLMDSFLPDLKPFILTHDAIVKNSGLTQYQIRNCKKRLKKMGVITTEMQDAPAKEYYRINLTELNNLLGMSILPKVGAK